MYSIIIITIISIIHCLLFSFYLSNFFPVHYGKEALFSPVETLLSRTDVSGRSDMSTHHVGKEGLTGFFPDFSPDRACTLLFPSWISSIPNNPVSIMCQACCAKTDLSKNLERGIEANTAERRPRGVGGWAKRHSDQSHPADSRSTPRPNDSISRPIDWLRSPSTPRSLSRCGHRRGQWPSKTL